MISSQDETEGEISATVLAPEGEGDISYTLLDETETTLCRTIGDIKTVRVEFIKDRGNVTAVDTDLGGTVSSEKIHEGHYCVWAGAYDKAGTLVAQSESQEFVNLKGGNAESKTLQLVWSAESAGSLLAVRFFDLTSNSLIGETSVSKGERLSKSNIPHKNGFLFSDWYKDSSLTQAFFDGSEDSLESILYSITLWGKAEIEEVAQTYTVSFESNGGSAVSAQTVSDGDFAKKPADPEKDGKAFSGWFTSLDGGETLFQTEFDFSTPITSDITLYAKWSETVLYVSENGSDENSGFSELEAVKTLSKAASLVDEYSKTFGEDAAWKIYIIGNIAECAKIESTKAKSIALQGKTGTNTDSLDGEKNGTTLSIKTAVPIKITKLKITNGKASGNGGGISVVSGNLTLASGVLLCGNESAQNGGGVWNSASTLTIDGAVISGNTANQHGGGIYNCSDATLVFISGAITRNEAAKYGGGVYNANAFTMSGGTIRENKASEGAGVNTAGDANGTFSMSGGSISNNTATEKGGGIYSAGTLTITDSTISGNKAKNGAGIYIAGGNTTFKAGDENDAAKYVKIQNNTATKNGGGIFVAGSYGGVSLDYVTITGNKAVDGAGVYDADIVRLQNPATISGNTASGNGGGVYQTDGAKLDAYNTTVTVSGNTATKDGGGVYFANANGDFTATVNSNTAANGGGIYLAAGSLSFGYGMTIAENTASASGGGIYSAGTLTIADGNTIRENTASTGGGVSVASGTLKMSGGTISANEATNGGGVYFKNDSSGSFTMSGSASVASNNDVYLDTGKTITVGGAFDASVTTPVATITPSSYTAGTQVLSGSADLLSSEHGKFSVTPETNGNAWAIDSAGKLQNKITLSALDSANITDPSVLYVITGATGQNNSQIDINNGVTTSADSTYYITLDNVKRTAGEWASGLFIYNMNPGTTLTVYITLVGENSIIAGKNHGGLQVKAVSGATVNVIFMTTTGGSLFLDSQAKTDIVKESDGTVIFSVESGSYFSGTSGGSAYTDASTFFTAAQNSTSGSTFSLTTTP